MPIKEEREKEKEYYWATEAISTVFFHLLVTDIVNFKKKAVGVISDMEACPGPLRIQINDPFYE